MMILHNDIHIHNKLSKLILIYYAVFVLVNSLKEGVEFGKESFMFFKLEVQYFLKKLLLVVKFADHFALLRQCKLFIPGEALF